MKRFVFALALLPALLCASAYADEVDYSAPDYLTLGGGAFDFDKHTDDRRAVDYRVEYEWGASLLPMIADSFDDLDPYMQIHPNLGFEGSSKGSSYPNAGLNLDIPFLWHKAVFTWGEAIGLYERGNSPVVLGSLVEFRSQLELGWQFDNDMRVTGYISHLSNASMGTINPGAEIVGAYLHIPLDW